MSQIAIHVIGNVGVVFVLAAYFLVSSGRVSGESVRYQLLNLVGAVILTAYGAVFAAWASVALNAIWAGIALVALVRIRRRSAQAG